MDNYIFWGFAASEQLRQNCEYYVESQGGKLLFYVDDNKDIQDGVNILSSDAILQYSAAKIVVLSAGIGSILRKVREYNLLNEIFVAPLLGFRFLYDEFLPPIKMLDIAKTWIEGNEESLRKLYSLDDMQTSNILNVSIKQRKSFEWQDPEELEKLNLMISNPNYFSYQEILPKFEDMKNITVIDGGAYIGDSIEQIYGIFGDKIGKIYAFEPNVENIKSAKNRLSYYRLENKIVWFNNAISDENSYKKFAMVGKEYVEFSNNIPGGGINIEAVKLDDVIFDVTDNIFIKMDIEGGEVKAILGAKNLIKKYKPIMALCTYHHMRDIYDIPRVVNEISPDYKFYLRDGLHTVCYCIPTNR